MLCNLKSCSMENINHNVGGSIGPPSDMKKVAALTSSALNLTSPVASLVAAVIQSSSSTLQFWKRSPQG